MQLKAGAWSCDVNGYVGLGALWLVRYQLGFVDHSAELGKRTACREWKEHGAGGCMDRQKTGSELRHHRQARRLLKKAKCGLMTDLMSPQAALVLTLQDLAPKFGCFDGPQIGR
jgi:hypothetical protein